MLELADKADLESAADSVWVQVPLPTPKYWGVAKRLTHKTLTLAFGGSNPSAPAITNNLIKGDK